ncbi:MAG: hypothetical protein HRT71_19040 [Flavobacteriales bacterium]|nr:hypothetical protein [Flavobacteriales bacterium]
MIGKIGRYLFFAILTVFIGCIKDPEVSLTTITGDFGGYPEEIAKILIDNCATSGCHNTASKEAASGLSFQTWDAMFEGSRNNSAVIPYRPDESFMLFFINNGYDINVPPSGDSLIQIAPLMPYDNDPLTEQQVNTLIEWINNGAPNAAGEVKFADDPNRSKIYVANQGKDNIAVIDAESRLIMRYFDVGAKNFFNSPHHIKVSNDDYLYACYYSGRSFQKFDTRDDSFASEADVGLGSWNTFVISEDAKTAYLIHWFIEGAIVVVDLETMTEITRYTGRGLFEWPHGCALKNDSTLYVTAQYGNFIYKLDVSDVMAPKIEEITMTTGAKPSVMSVNDPHEIRFSPDKSEYAITCQKSNDVRFFQSSNDSLIAVVSTGNLPLELEYSTSSNYLFVTCMEDEASFPGKVGSVHIIDYVNHTLEKVIYTGYQPHGLVIDDKKHEVWIANRNVSTDGPAPHHSTSDNARNGYLTIIDLNTLELIPHYRTEVSVDPYTITIRN